MSRFNNELQWLGETLGIPLKSLANNGHLSGAIFGRITDLVGALLDRLEQGDEFRCVEEFTAGNVFVTKGQMVTFERLDDIAKPNRKLVMSIEEGIEFRLGMWDFIRKFRFGESQCY